MVKKLSWLKLTEGDQPQPNLNPHAERFAKSIKYECLNNFVFFGEWHLRYVIREYMLRPRLVGEYKLFAVLSKLRVLNSQPLHGYTDFSMEMSKLLGFDLCPRLKNLKHRRLHVPTNAAIPKVVEPLVDRDVRMDVILNGWDGFFRVTASIESGVTSATLALERFGSAAQGDPTYEAGIALGKLRRSLFLCDLSTNPKFRRELPRAELR